MGSGGGAAVGGTGGGGAVGGGATSAAGTAKVLVCATSGASAGHGKTVRRLPPAAAAEASVAELTERKESMERLTRSEGSTALAALAKRCQTAGLLIDLLITPSATNAFVDVASLMVLSSLTGGTLTHVPEVASPTAAAAAAASASPTAAAAGPLSGAARLRAAVRRAVCDVPAGSDAVFRLRTSPGLRASRVLSACGEAHENMVHLNAVHRHTTFAVELAHQAGAKTGAGGGSGVAKAGGDGGALLTAERAMVQSALLYTKPDGRRAIRVHTTPLRVVRDASSLVRAVHPPALAAMQAKLACDALRTAAASTVAEQAESSCASCVLAMRELCPPPLRRLAEEMILTRPLELLLLLTFATLKLPPLAARHGGGGALVPDATAAAAARVLGLPAHEVNLMLVPRVHLIHLRNEGDGWIAAEASPPAAKPPPPAADANADADADAADAADAAADAANAAADAEAADGAADGAARAPPTRDVPTAAGVQISPAGVYVLDACDELVVWVGQHASPAFLTALFGTATPADGAPLQPVGRTDEASKLHALIDEARGARSVDPPLRVIVQGSAEQWRFFSRLAGDGYEQFVMQLHAARVKPKL